MTLNIPCVFDPDGSCPFSICEGAGTNDAGKKYLMNLKIMIKLRRLLPMWI